MKQLTIKLNDQIAINRSIVNLIVNTATVIWDENPITGISDAAIISVLSPSTLTITKTTSQP